MGVWGFLIILLVVAWLLQIVLTYYQNKHYGETIRRMVEQYSSGYLGVGVVKKRLGVGSVMILVTDQSGQVVEAKELTGVTVFSRFQSVKELGGQTLSQLFSLSGKDNRTQAIKMAAEQIKEQKEQHSAEITYE